MALRDCRTGPCLALAACAVLVFTALVRADQPISLSVTVDGKTQLRADFPAAPADSKAKKWFYLENVALVTEPGVEITPDDEDDPYVSVLRGDIRVRVEGVGEAAVKSLKLVAADEDYTSWHLDSEQIENMAGSLGLERPDVPPPPETLPERLQNTETPWAWVILLTIVLAVGALLLLRRRQRPDRTA